MPKAFKLPKQPAQMADLLYQLREERHELNRQVAAIEEKESQLKAWLIDNLPKSQAGGITGRIARVEIVTKVIPQVKDWTKFYAYVVKNKAFDLLQRRLNNSAVEERWAKKKVIDGTGKFNAVSVSVTKK